MISSKQILCQFITWFLLFIILILEIVICTQRLFQYGIYYAGSRYLNYFNFTPFGITSTGGTSEFQTLRPDCTIYGYGKLFTTVECNLYNGIRATLLISLFTGVITLFLLTLTYIPSCTRRISHVWIYACHCFILCTQIIMFILVCVFCLRDYGRFTFEDGFILCIIIMGLQILSIIMFIYVRFQFKEEEKTTLIWAHEPIAKYGTTRVGYGTNNWEYEQQQQQYQQQYQQQPNMYQQYPVPMQYPPSPSFTAAPMQYPPSPSFPAALQYSYPPPMLYSMPTPMPTQSYPATASLYGFTPDMQAQALIQAQVVIQAQAQELAQARAQLVQAQAKAHVASTVSASASASASPSAVPAPAPAPVSAVPKSGSGPSTDSQPPSASTAVPLPPTSAAHVHSNETIPSMPAHSSVSQDAAAVPLFHDDKQRSSSIDAISGC